MKEKEEENKTLKIQAVKKVMEIVKETATNNGSSAMFGLEKTKVTLHDKVNPYAFMNIFNQPQFIFNSEHMSVHYEKEKNMATQKKQEKIKYDEMENAVTKQYVVVRQTHGPRLTQLCHV